MKQRQWLVTIVSLLLFTVVLYSGKAHANTIDLNGGVKNENTYEEYIFLTGQPIKLTGSNKNVSVTVKEGKDKVTETYKLTLTGANGEQLSRQFTYVFDVTNYDQIGQSTATGEVTKYTEKITIGNKTYTLTDYQFSKSAVTDKRPASDYFSGNAVARKTYSVKQGRNTSEMIVHIDSRNEGYENFWERQKHKLLSMK